MCGFEGMWKDNARVAQLVEYNLAKVGVAGSSPVSRSQQYEKRYPETDILFLIVRALPGGNIEVYAPLRSLQSERLLDVLQLPATGEWIAGIRTY